VAPLVIAVAPWVWDWANLGFRWLHVIAAIAWIGASFYLIALDNHLRPPAEERDRERCVGGESWEIHGGGFYRIEKFTVAPAALPETLHWFKWEAYTTWLSGFALYVVVYYVHASTFLVDPSVAKLSAWEAIAISVGGLALSWVVYDGLCRALGRNELALAAAVFAFVALSAWGAGQLLAPRAAYVQVGAMIGTMMVGNVFFVIIPAHWELVRAKQAGREPDPAANARGKTRSVHNNYLTLPVVFAMISNHFPFTYGHAHGWLILVALMAIGAWVRHFFNLRHAGRTRWWIAATAALAFVGLAVLVRPSNSLLQGSTGAAVPFARVQAIVERRCTPCHSQRPTRSGFSSAPLGIRFDTRAEIESQAARIKEQAVDTHAMPLGNVTHMTQTERDTLARWLAAR
jgi:uncharacterized membrane protein